MTSTVEDSPPRLLARVGEVLVSPRLALRRVEASGGALRDAAWLVALGVLCLRVEELVRAVVATPDVTAGLVLGRLVGAVFREINEAAVVIVPAAILLTIVAGAGRRDPGGRDLELAAACYAPFFAVRAVFRTLVAIYPAADQVGPLLTTGKTISVAVAGAWALSTFVQAVHVMRGRVSPPPSDAAPRISLSPARSARRAGLALGLLLGVAMVAKGTWLVRHFDEIRPLRKGERAPDFSLARIDDVRGRVTLTSLRGKVVLLDFWASWCAPCVGMMPVLHRLYEEWRPRGVEFIGINAEGEESTAEDVRKFLVRRPAPYPMVADDGRAAVLYKVTGLPHIVLIDREGTVQKVFLGAAATSELEAALRRVTGER